jgi:ParB family chromosome partitioning protein
MTLSVALSKLVAARTNPRRVKPEREAHRKLVASIRTHDLLEPLVVRKLEDGRYEVIAGKRRLAALRAVHPSGDPKVDCVLKQVDNDTARAIGLSENFAREAMHPLDEAEAFAKLASVDCKGVAEIAAEFGVGHPYIRQRMKLAGLAGEIKEAYRAGAIDTLTAETLSSVPVERQMEVWEEVGGQPEDAGQVRTIIYEQWIDAERALFDLATLPPAAVSNDLFGERVRIERAAFMEAQRGALEGERERLVEDGWREVVVAERSQVQDRLYAMATPHTEYDADTQAKLNAIEARREAFEQSLADREETEADSDQFEALNREEEAVIAGGHAGHSEATKASGTVFLLLAPDGRASREVRVPRSGSRGNGNPVPEQTAPPTSADLSQRQQAAIYAHEAIAVREAVEGNALVRKRLLMLALHDRVSKDGLAIRADANGTTIHAEEVTGFASDTFKTLELRRREIDPLAAMSHVEEVEAYDVLCGLDEARLDHLIEVLTVDLLTGHGSRPTPLIQRLREELGVNVRQHWRPDAAWLGGFQKCQLADLVEKLRGPAHGAAALRRKKSELVVELDRLFVDALAGTLEDAALAERVNQWTPNSLRHEEPTEAKAVA